jgi:hypothetical protein
LSHGLMLQFLVGALNHNSTILSGFQSVYELIER